MCDAITFQHIHHIWVFPIGNRRPLFCSLNFGDYQFYDLNNEVDSLVQMHLYNVLHYKITTN